jgi:hypothetical protein
MTMNMLQMDRTIVGHHLYVIEKCTPLADNGVHYLGVTSSTTALVDQIIVQQVH